MSQNPAQTKEEPTLYKRSIKSGYWVILLRISTSLLSLFKVIVVANFFELKDLGIITVAYMIMDILSVFSQTGFETALVQKKGEIRDYLDTVWMTCIIKGILLFVILYVSAPLLASFKIPEDKLQTAVAVFRVLGLSFVISGFQNIGILYFQKNLEFKYIFIMSFFSTLADVCLSILLLLVFQSIWCVIAARLASAAVNLAISYYLSEYRPRFRFEFSKARELWTYGRWIFGQNSIGYILETGYDYFVLFYLGALKTPLYRYAYSLSNMPVTQISYAVSQVSFAAFSKIQDDLPRLRQAYFKVLRLTSLLSIPITVMILILGPDFVRLFLPEYMSPIVPALRILAVKGLMGSLSATWSPMARAIGRPEKINKLMIICLVVMGVSIYPFTRWWGITGTALSCLLMGMVPTPYGYYFMCHLLKCSLFAILRQYGLPLVSSALMAAGILALKHSVLAGPGYLPFFLLAFAGSVIYMNSAWLLDGVFRFGLREMLIDQVVLIKSSMK